MCQTIGISIVLSSSSISSNNRNKSSMKCNWSGSGSLNRVRSRPAPPPWLMSIVPTHLSIALSPLPCSSICHINQACINQA